MHTLNILSLNVNGLNSAVKRTRVLEYLQRRSFSCALIQEKHLKQFDVARFQNKYYKLIAFSCAQNKTKGVLILVFFLFFLLSTIFIFYFFTHNITEYPK